MFLSMVKAPLQSQRACLITKHFTGVGSPFILQLLRARGGGLVLTFKRAEWEAAEKPKLSMVKTMMSLAFWVDLIPTPLSWLEKCIELLWPLVSLWKSSFYFKVQCQRGSAGNETPLHWHLSLTWSSPPKEKCLNWRAPIMNKTVPQAIICRLPLTVALRLVKDRNI